ncbi:MAG: methyltransferase domain-containing protein [Chloroflexi bacterium]|nr:methyltransferase domain-containing protein [Chloroflexota bacterium]
MPTEADERPSSNPREALRDYRQMQHLSESQEDDASIAQQPRLVSRFYDAVTRLYEYGWGANFHFSPRQPGESLVDSQRRQHLGVGQILRLKPGMEVADIGCGVAGPMVSIAESTAASITGINFNAYQIERGQRRVSQAGLGDSCQFLYADFMDVPLEDETFDAIYAFEATCHAPNKLLLFQELYRLLKSGGEMAIIDWCLTDRFDAADAHHREIRLRIETNNATSSLRTPEQQVDTIRQAGFEIVEAFDQQAANGNPRTPWYMALQGRDFSLSSWARTPTGRKLTTVAMKFLERLRIVPTGTSETAAFLNVAADALVEAGELEIFTPSFLVHARKPAVDRRASC